MTVFFQLLVGGLAVGGMYGLVALGLVLVYKASGVLNFAHGAFMSLGAYLGYTTLSSWHLNVVLGFGVVIAVMAVFGLAMYFLLVRPLVGKPLLIVVLATIGVSLGIEGVLQIIYGVNPHPTLHALPHGHFKLGHVQITWISVIIVVATMVAVLLFGAFFTQTRLGLQMRVLTDNLHAAVGVGVRPNLVLGFTWAIALAFAGVAGVLYGHYSASVNPSLADIALAAFPAAVIGGMDSLPGALVGGLVVGTAEQMASGYIGADWGTPIAFTTLFVVLLIRPAGLFGSRDVARV